MKNTIITNLNTVRVELMEQYNYHLAEADKIKKQIDSIDGIILTQCEEGYETRANDTIPEGELGYEPTRSIAYNGEVFRYEPNGEFVVSYKNTEEAQKFLREEINKPFLDCKSTIGYCCNGSYNQKPNVNHHMYKKRVWFDRKLTEEEVELCFELGIFKR